MTSEEKGKIFVDKSARQDVREFLQEEIQAGINKYKSFVINTIKGIIVEDDGKHVMSDGRICIQCEHNTLLYKLLEVLKK